MRVHSFVFINDGVCEENGCMWKNMSESIWTSMYECLQSLKKHVNINQQESSKH